MSKPIDLYDSHYEHGEDDVYRVIRAEAFGEDLGQTSWITAAECDEFCGWLEIDAGTRVLEVACGSGGVATRIADRFGARVVGVDINDAAVGAASKRARDRGVEDRVRFECGDANRPLPFDDRSFDIVFCNDAINHLKDRRRVLADWHRMLRPGGRCLYTDPVVITGPLSGAEIATRSSIGFFLFTPPGFNERLLRSAGFSVVRVEDRTLSVSRTSQRWHEARAKQRNALGALEGEAGYEHTQRFLAMVRLLADERRLSRLAFLSLKKDNEGGPAT